LQSFNFLVIKSTRRASLYFENIAASAATDGSLRCACTTKKRVATLPDVSTSAEAGSPEFDVTTWYGLYAPRGTLKPVIDQLVGALQTRLEIPH
jgi:tripartite-type tricarboxylate transporter receptor subunit TctC